MSYTEIQTKKGKRYYYRVKSIKKKGKVSKERIYLGAELSESDLKKYEKEADAKLNRSLNHLLNPNELTELGSIKKKFKVLPKSTFHNRYETFVSKFTYNSNAIEGNTFSLQETSFLLFENRTPPGKSIREINEVLNHKNAFDYMLDYKGDITKDFICMLQKKVTENTLKKNQVTEIGKYRSVQVYIRGAKIVPSHPDEVSIEMRTLLRWYNANKDKLHPLIVATYFHTVFEAVHPFIDGNGRTGRLLLNFILHKNKYPMINIPNSKKLTYYACLEKAQVKNDLRRFVKFLYLLISNSENYI